MTLHKAGNRDDCPHPLCAPFHEPANRPAEATPGPWTLREWGEPNGGFTVEGPGDSYIADVYAGHHPDDTVNGAMGRANARLIASAPSLLAQADAARGLVEAADRWTNSLAARVKWLVEVLGEAKAHLEAVAPTYEAIDLVCALIDAAVVDAQKHVAALAAYAAAAPGGDGDAPASTEGQQDA